MIRHLFDAAIELDPAAGEVDEGTRFTFCNEAGLESLFIAAGLRRVETRAIDAPTRFANFEDFWAPFLAGTGVAPAYVMSLPEARRSALRDVLLARLPMESDRSLNLIARAWAIRGTR